MSLIRTVILIWCICLSLQLKATPLVTSCPQSPTDSAASAPLPASPWGPGITCLPEDGPPAPGTAPSTPPSRVISLHFRWPLEHKQNVKKKKGKNLTREAIRNQTAFKESGPSQALRLRVNAMIHTCYFIPGCTEYIAAGRNIKCCWLCSRRCPGRGSGPCARPPEVCKSPSGPGQIQF